MSSWDDVLVTKDPKKKEVLISFPGTGGFGAVGSLNPDAEDPGGLPVDPDDSTPVIPESPDNGLGGDIVPEPVPPSQGGIPACQPQDCTIDVGSVFTNGGGVIFIAQDERNPAGLATEVGDRFVRGVDGGLISGVTQKNILNDEGSPIGWSVRYVGSEGFALSRSASSSLTGINCGGEAYLLGYRPSRTDEAIMPNHFFTDDVPGGFMSQAQAVALPDDGGVYPYGVGSNVTTDTYNGSSLLLVTSPGPIGSSVTGGLTRHQEKRFYIDDASGTFSATSSNQQLSRRVDPMELRITNVDNVVGSIQVRLQDGSYSASLGTAPFNEPVRFDWSIKITSAVSAKSWTLSSEAFGIFGEVPIAVNWSVTSTITDGIPGGFADRSFASQALPPTFSGYLGGNSEAIQFYGPGIVLALGDAGDGPYNAKMAEIERSFLTYTPPSYCERLP